MSPTRETALRATQAALAAAGLGVAVYLSVERAAGDSPACVVGGGCAVVQASRYSAVAGVPVAYMGVAAYLALLALALAPGPAGRWGGFVVALGGFAFSAWLTYAELALIHAVCMWCVISAVLMTLILVVAAVRAALAPAPAAPPPALAPLPAGEEPAA